MLILIPNSAQADSASECNNAASYTMGTDSTSSAAQTAMNDCINTLSQFSSSSLSSAFSQCKNENLGQLEAWGSLNSSAAFEVIYKCAYKKLLDAQSSTIEIVPIIPFYFVVPGTTTKSYDQLFIDITKSLVDHASGFKDIYKKYDDSIADLVGKRGKAIYELSKVAPISKADFDTELNWYATTGKELANQKDGIISGINDDISILNNKKTEYLNLVSDSSTILKFHDLTNNVLQSAITVVNSEYNDTRKFIDDWKSYISANVKVASVATTPIQSATSDTPSTTIISTAAATNTCTDDQILVSGKCECKYGYEPSGSSYGTHIYCYIIPRLKLVGEVPFSDVNSIDGNLIAISYLKDNAIISGYEDGTFQPKKTVNRAELLKILIGTALPVGNYGSCFTDVKDEWFAPYICYAKEQGWIQGYADGTFKPAQTVNRAEAIKMAMEVFGLSSGNAVEVDPFPDTEHTQWFAAYVQDANEKGLLDFSTRFFAPSDGMTRGSISEIIYRALAIQKLQVEKFNYDLDEKMIEE